MTAKLRRASRSNPMRRSTPFVRTTLLVLCSAFISIALQAQYRASIQGVVTDPQGAVVQGAIVTLIDKQTNRTVTATSDANGIYNFNALPLSNYTVTAEKSGFKNKTLDNYVPVADQSNALNLELELGEATETVTVSADEIAPIETQTATISGTVTSNQIEHMPSFGRDVFQLIQLAPGVFGRWQAGRRRRRRQSCRHTGPRFNRRQRRHFRHGKRSPGFGRWPAV